MAKFCTKCGKPLEEGEICSCTQVQQMTEEMTAQQADAGAQTQANPQQADAGVQAQANSQQANAGVQANPQQANAGAQANPQQANAGAQAQANPQQANAGAQQQVPPAGYMPNDQQFQQTQQAVAGFLSRAFGVFLNIIKHPVTAGRETILAGDAAVASALIVLQGIISMIFGVIAAKKVYSVVSMFIGGWSSLFGYDDDIKMPYVKIIFGTLLISIALSFVLALLLFLGNMIIKNSLSFKQMMSAAAIRSCVTILSTIVAIIVFLIYPAAGILVFVTGTVWGFFIIILAMPLANEGMRNKLPLTIMLVFLVFAFITGLCMSKGANLYVPSEEAFESDSWFD